MIDNHSPQGPAQIEARGLADRSEGLAIGVKGWRLACERLNIIVRGWPKEARRLDNRRKV